MGVQHKARIEQEKKIATIQAELAPIEGAIFKELAAEAEIDREIAKLAVKAAHGDREALKKQRELRTRKDEHHLQSSNIETMAVPIRRSLAAAESEIPHFILAELHERVADGIRELPAMGAELSKVVQPIAKAFGEFRARIDAATAEALPLIARGNPDRILSLENRIRTMLIRGIRAQLCFDFRSEGLDIIDASQFEGKNFQCVVEPVLRSMIAALEVDLHANGVPTPGRANFRCATNISGLFGMRLRAGEVASLPVDDENVRKLMEAGGLEIIDNPTPVKTEEGA
jgi:hypothetical protein